MVKLSGKRIALLAASGFEYLGLLEILHALNECEALCEIISTESTAIRGWHAHGWAEFVPVDMSAMDATAREFDALIITGGVMSCDVLRASGDVLRFVNNFCSQRKPIAALGHGAQILISAEVIDGVRITAPRSIHTDLENAGADVVEEPLVIDGTILSIQVDSALPIYIRKIVELFSEYQSEVSRGEPFNLGVGRQSR